MKKLIVLFTVLGVSGCSSLVNPSLGPEFLNSPFATVEPLTPIVAGAAGIAAAEVVTDALSGEEVLEPLVPVISGVAAIATAAAVSNALPKAPCSNEGCLAPGEKVKNDPFFAPVEPIEADRDIVESGSLFQDSYANNLYSDIKAHRVGDIITVYLEESTSAKKQAGTSFDKNSSFSVAIEDITLPSTKESGVSVYGGGGEGNQTSNFSGDSGTDQSNSLEGSITVNVTRVLSNGNLEIRGEKWLMLNNGEEFIRIKGMIRSEDVSSDNSVSSTHIANSRIQYGGTGDFANTQKQGWLTSFFNENWSL